MGTVSSRKAPEYQRVLASITLKPWPWAGGGDTDANACIVGGLVGAFHGEEGIHVFLIL